MKQKLKAILDDDRGVSPVIGVILMVAITVILAAVIGGFVLNLGGNLQSAPQAQMSIEKQDDASGNTDIVIKHKGGDAINTNDLSVTVDGATKSLSWPDSEFSVGETATAATGVGSGEITVTVVHEPSESILVEGTVTVSS